MKVCPPQPQVAVRTRCALLLHWNPSAERGNQTHRLEAEWDLRQPKHLAPTSELKEKNWEPSNSCTEEFQFGDVNDIWTRFPDPQVKSEEWNLCEQRRTLSAESSHWSLPWFCRCDRDMYKCYSAPSHLKMIDKVLEDQKQEKPTKKMGILEYGCMFLQVGGYSKLPSLPLIIQFSVHTHDVKHYT